MMEFIAGIAVFMVGVLTGASLIVWAFLRGGSDRWP